MTSLGWKLCANGRITQCCILFANVGPSLLQEKSVKGNEYCIFYRSQMYLGSDGATPPAWGHSPSAPTTTRTSVVFLSNCSLRLVCCCCCCGLPHLPLQPSCPLVHRQNVWLVRHYLFASLYLEVPQDLVKVVLHHLWRCIPCWPWCFYVVHAGRLRWLRWVRLSVLALHPNPKHCNFLSSIHLESSVLQILNLLQSSISK